MAIDNTANELGFGSKAANQKTRMLNQNGSFNVDKRGLSRVDSFSLYHHLLNLPIWKFIGIIVSGYLVMNLFFTILYLVFGVQHLTGIVGTSFLDKFCEAFFFSTQTFTTVGYGRVNPMGLPANIIASFESLFGLLSFAVATGLIYGRFSKPQAFFMFSKEAIVAPYAPTGRGLMFRIANKLNTTLIDAEAVVLFTYIDEASGIRKFPPLKLEISKISFLPSMWTIVHPIDENSPMYNWDEKKLVTADVELLIIIKAFDENFSQTVHSRFSYKHQEIEWGAKFVQALFNDEDGAPYAQMDKLSDYNKVEI